MTESPQPWWVARKSGGRPEAGLVAFIAVGVLFFGAASLATSLAGWWRLLLLAAVPGAVMLFRAIAAAVGGLRDPERSAAGWRPLVWGSLFFGCAVMLGTFVGALSR